MQLDLNSDDELTKAVIGSLTWGIECVSAQNETSMVKLADEVKEENPALADFILNSRFVDGQEHSEENKSALKKLVNAADNLFGQVGLKRKGWIYSFEDPSPNVKEDDGTVSIGGMRWHNKVDCMEVPQLHFVKKSRGRLVVGTEVYSGSCLEDLDKLVPKDLTLRMVLRRKESFFDLTGKFTPTLAGQSLLYRETAKASEGWDVPILMELRQKWIESFHTLEKLQGLKFNRAVMPRNTISPKMNLITAGYVAKEHVKITAVWGGFKLKEGGYSCQLVIGSPTPKGPLQKSLDWMRNNIEDTVEKGVLTPCVRAKTFQRQRGRP